MRRATLTLALLAGFAVPLGALSGCRTAEGVYTDAMALETSGQMEAAAQAYADALRRDPDLPNARGRLVVAGREAVRQRLASAAASETRSGAADHFLAAEAVVREAAGVGVEVERPATFAADVAAACAAAVDALLEAGVARIDAREYPAGLALLDRARAYRPSADRRASLDETARTAYTYWAGDDLEAGRFRAALAHADQALTLAAPGSSVAADLHRLRADVVDAGTVFAAVFPAERPRTPTGDALPDGFLRDVTDVLLDDRLAPPPLFVALVDPAETRRIVRQARADLSGNPRVLAELTRDLGADVGLVAEVDGFSFREAETGRRDVTFRLREGEGRAAGVRVTTEMTLRVRAALVAVAADGRRIACDSDVPSTVVTERYDTATTTAEVRTLRLSDDERDLFDAETRDRAYSRAVDRLRDNLADALADRVAGCLGQQVP
ncbi:MAG TPA: hypothetical protein VF576_08310 [Rubricoccaceae bacterium]